MCALLSIKLYCAKIKSKESKEFKSLINVFLRARITWRYSEILTSGNDQKYMCLQNEYLL